MPDSFSVFQSWSRNDLQIGENSSVTVPETNFNISNPNPNGTKSAVDSRMISIASSNLDYSSPVTGDGSFDFVANGQESFNLANVDRSIMLDRSMSVLVPNGMSMRDLSSAIYGGPYPLAAICELNGLTPDIVSVDSGEQIIEPTFSQGRTYRLPASADVERLTQMFWKRIMCGCEDEKGYLDIPPMPAELNPLPVCQPPEKPPVCPPPEKPPVCPPPEKPPACKPPEKTQGGPPPKKDRREPNPNEPSSQGEVDKKQDKQVRPAESQKAPEQRDQPRPAESAKAPEHRDQPKPAESAKAPERHDQPKSADPPKKHDH